MKTNRDLVSAGFDILMEVDCLPSFIYRKMKGYYGTTWWDEVYTVNRDIQGHNPLPARGAINELLKKLDSQAAFKVVMCRGVAFSDREDYDVKHYVSKLAVSRNFVAHKTGEDMTQEDSETDLFHMKELIRIIDKYMSGNGCDVDATRVERVEKLYLEMRSRSEHNGLTMQPASESKTGEKKHHFLLDMLDTEDVIKTTDTMTISFNGKTMVYPVYKIRLDKLYFNDLNDRIATFMSQYEYENGKDSIAKLDKNDKNKVLEKYIRESDPVHFERTKADIAEKSQMLPGVVLDDGRVVDGNRRFACLREIKREDMDKPIYFKAAIYDMDITEDVEQIKLLELSLQFGVDEKQDYDNVSRALGTYKYFKKNPKAKKEDYAKAANEKVADINRRIQIIGLIEEYLKHIKMPEAYHIISETGAYTAFEEILPLLFGSDLDENDKKTLKLIFFDNLAVKAVTDQKSFVRDIKKFIKNGVYRQFAANVKKICDEIDKKLKVRSLVLSSMKDLNSFAEANAELAARIQSEFKKTKMRLEIKTEKADPETRVKDCVDKLESIQKAVVTKLSDKEKQNLKDQLDKLEKLIAEVKGSL